MPNVLVAVVCYMKYAVQAEVDSGDACASQEVRGRRRGAGEDAVVAVTAEAAAGLPVGVFLLSHLFLNLLSEVSARVFES